MVTIGAPANGLPASNSAIRSDRIVAKTKDLAEALARAVDRTMAFSNFADIVESWLDNGVGRERYAQLFAHLRLGERRGDFDDAVLRTQEWLTATPKELEAALTQYWKKELRATLDQQSAIAPLIAAAVEHTGRMIDGINAFIAATDSLAALADNPDRERSADSALPRLLALAEKLEDDIYAVSASAEILANGPKGVSAAPARWGLRVAE